MKHEHLTVARLFHALPFSRLRILKFQCLLARWSKRGSTRCPSSLLPSTSMISIPVYPPSCGRSRSHPAATLDSVAEEEGCRKRQETTIACAGKRSYFVPECQAKPSVALPLGSYLASAGSGLGDHRVLYRLRRRLTASWNPLNRTSAKGKNGKFDSVETNELTSQVRNGRNLPAPTSCPSGSRVSRDSPI